MGKPTVVVNGTKVWATIPLPASSEDLQEAFAPSFAKNTPLHVFGAGSLEYKGAAAHLDYTGFQFEYNPNRQVKDCPLCRRRDFSKTLDGWSCCHCGYEER